jgi:molybdopterin-guanine dinucleotide biosynthesis protein A
MGGSGHAGEVTGVILAGGRARRFSGRNKALLEIEGRRIVDRQLAALEAVTVEQVIVANDAADYRGLGVAVMPDSVADAGPLGGLYTALQASLRPRLLVLACDLPFIDAPFLRFLVERAPEADAVVPRTGDGLHTLSAVYARRILPVVAARLTAGRLAMHELLAEIMTVVLEPEELAPYDPQGRLLANINTLDEYEAWRRPPGPSAPPGSPR